MSETQKCSICGVELSEHEVYIFQGRTLCEDCHMEETHPVKVCNPLPVMAAKNLGTTKKDPEEVLDELQKSIYTFVMDNKKVTIYQLSTEFNLTEAQLTNQIAILRHLELIKGKKQGAITYIVPF
jgi:predicted HTH transcriptional regulator